MIFFNNKAIGVDIDDRSIELVELKKQGSKAKLVNFSRQALPQGVVVNGLVKNPEQLKIYLLKAFAQAKPGPISPKNIALTLPEAQCYSLVASLDLTEKDISDEDIKQLIVKNLPLAFEELIFDYQIIQSSAKESLIFLAGASKAAVKGWLDFFAGMDIDLDFIDNEVFAVARDLVYLDNKQPICLVDIGSVRTNINIIQDSAIYYDSSLASGGHWFTKNIAQAFKLKLVTAERKKLQLGLNQQIFPVLSKQLKSIAAEIRSAVDYYQDHYGGAVKEVVMVGGSSRLRGLVEFLQENVGLPVSLGKIKSMGDKLPLEYFGAIGAAWRVLNEKKYQDNPDFFSLLAESKPLKIKTEIKKETMIIKKNPAPIIEDRDETETDDLEELTAPVNLNDDDLDSDDSGPEDKRLAAQKKMLLAVLLVGVLLLPLAFWYREQERSAREERNKKYASASYVQTQNLIFTIPVVIDTAAAEPTETKGRIVEATISAGQNYTQALPDALSQAKTKLVKDEVIWPTPLNEVISQETLKEPLVLRFLAYSQPAVVKAGLGMVDNLNKNKIDYSFNNLEVLELIKTDNVSRLNLKINISISSNEQISQTQTETLNAGEQPGSGKTNPDLDIATSSPASPELEKPQASSTEQVIIKTTETGWLNIRAGPGKNFPLVEQIDDSGSYPFLEQSGEWIKIQLPSGKTGWGSIRYIQKD